MELLGDDYVGQKIDRMEFGVCGRYIFCWYVRLFPLLEEVRGEELWSEEKKANE